VITLSLLFSTPALDFARSCSLSPDSSIGIGLQGWGGAIAAGSKVDCCTEGGSATSIPSAAELWVQVRAGARPECAYR
jgi:hypothetical protein